jgi:riboflavin synthase
MFTGLVEGIARVVDRRAVGEGAKLTIAAGPVADDVRIGDSVSVSGCCLTVVARDEDRLAFDLGNETLARTKLGVLEVGSAVNVERALRFGDRLGGHLVSGHIDGLGRLLERHDTPEWSTCWFEAPLPLLKQMAAKGSVAIDGVSLTLVEVHLDRFSVMLIPHTLTVTTLGQLSVGDTVNLETDLLAKYVERQLRLSGN